MDSTRIADDTLRLDLLRRLDLLSADPDPALDRLSRIAAAVTGAEIAMITFIAGDRQFIRSRIGTEATEASMKQSLCVCTLEGDRPRRNGRRARGSRRSGSSTGTRSGRTRTRAARRAP